MCKGSPEKFASESADSRTIVLYRAVALAGPCPRTGPQRQSSRRSGGADLSSETGTATIRPLMQGADMIAVIFEVWPKTEGRKEYLDIAASLRPLLETIDGFISIERFESLYEPGKILSLSFFRDEEAVKAWRNTEAH